MIVHIKDLSRVANAGSIGAPLDTNNQVFRIDPGDIVSLLWFSPAAEGGESLISSSWLVCNVLARKRPDLIHTLAPDWPVNG